MPIKKTVAGPAEELAVALRALRAQAGMPSTRVLAQSIGTVSHTTVADALAGRRVPSWPVVASVVRVLDGDEEQFKQLWLKARSAASLSAGQAEDDFVGRYLRQVVAHTSWLEFPEPARQLRVAFDELYVPQRVVPVPAGNEENLWALDDQLHREVLLGNPGIGKSTACRALMLRHAAQRDRPVPFLVAMREFSATTPPARSVVGHLEHTVETFFQIKPPEGTLGRLLSEGRALIIFDGLDELPGAAAQATTSVIELFCKQFPAARVLVTARPAGYAQSRLDPGMFREYRLLGFSEDQVADYVHKWFALAPDLPDQERQRLAEAFLPQVARVLDISSNPLRLGLASQLYAKDGVLPRDLIRSGFAPGDQPVAARERIPGATGPMIRILLVENDEKWRHLISMTLPEYRVDEAQSYREALELLRDGPPYDVAIVDLNLMDSESHNTQDHLGGNILLLLRDEYPSTRRIAMTSYPPSAIRHVFDLYDVDDLLIMGNMELSVVREVVEAALTHASSNVSLDLEIRKSSLRKNFRSWREDTMRRLDYQAQMLQNDLCASDQMPVVGEDSGRALAALRARLATLNSERETIGREFSRIETLLADIDNADDASLVSREISDLKLRFDTDPQIVEP